MECDHLQCSDVAVRATKQAGAEAQRDQLQGSHRAAMDMDTPVGMDMERGHLQRSDVVVRAAMDMDMPVGMDMQRDHLHCSDVVARAAGPAGARVQCDHPQASHRAAMELAMPVGMDMERDQ
eukprot:6292170-Karenia_brevis.AAC.1